MIEPSRVQSSAFITMIALVLLAGCGGGGYADADADAGSHPDASTGAEPVVLEVSPEAAAILAKADLADGTEDHVVTKCASCDLAMDGKAENAVQVGEYEMHFCSDTCSRRFKENTEASILGLPQS